MPKKASTPVKDGAKDTTKPMDVSSPNPKGQGAGDKSHSLGTPATQGSGRTRCVEMRFERLADPAIQAGDAAKQFEEDLTSIDGIESQLFNFPVADSRAGLIRVVRKTDESIAPEVLAELEKISCGMDITLQNGTCFIVLPKNARIGLAASALLDALEQYHLIKNEAMAERLIYYDNLGSLNKEWKEACVIGVVGVPFESFGRIFVELDKMREAQKKGTQSFAGLKMDRW